ncbi:hypothetical protein ACFL5N_00260 [bacterium]
MKSKIIFLATFILFFAISYVHSLEITSEILISNLFLEEKHKSAHIRGTIFTKLINTKNFLVDLHYELSDERQKLNVAYLKFLEEKFEIAIGRQLMAWGSGYNFNPTDIFNKKPIGAAFDPAYIKRGRDAVIFTSYYWDFITDVVFAPHYSFSEKIEGSISLYEKGREDFGLRIKRNIRDFDLEVSYIKLGKRTFTFEGTDYLDKSDDILGFSAKGSLPVIDWGIWLEAARYLDQNVSEYVTGLEYIFDRWTLNFEYYRTGFGSANKNFYDFELMYRGRMVGRDYFAPSVIYVFNEKYTLTGFVFSNLNDSSNVFGAVIEYFYNDIIELAFLPFFMTGDTDSEYGSRRAELGNFGIQALIKITF